MPNPYNGSRSGKRGGSIYRPSRLAERVLDSRPAALRKGHPLSQPDSAPSTWNATESVAVAWQCAEEIEETREGFGIPAGGNFPGVKPRRSLTEQQHLEARPERLEFGVRRERRILKKWNGRTAQWEPVFDAPPKKGMAWVPRPIWVKGMPDADGWTENPTLLWRSDATLLRRGLPDQAPKDIKRIDPYTKRIVREEPETAATAEIPAMDISEIDALNIDYND